MKSSAKRMLLSVLIAAGLILASLAPAMGQTRSIRGKIVDEKGNPIEGVQVTIQATDAVRTMSSKTNRRGEFTFLLGIAAMTYRVFASKEGFGPVNQENIRPDLTQAFEVNFTLKPGPDHKLPFEFSPEELADLQRQHEKQREQEKFAEEVKVSFDLGVKYFTDGNYTGAIEEFNKALEKLPEEPTILANIGRSHAKMGKNELALEFFEKAIKFDPNDPAVHSDMAISLIALKRTEQAQEAFKKAAALDPAGAARNFFNLGASMINSGRTEEAAMAFRQAIAADPGYSDAYYQLGLSLSGKAATIPEAIEMLKKYISMGGKPDQVEVAKAIVEALGG
ncbi:MAG TPA: tetratricopeptide repeat protein [Acidobacteriota bacterium]|nr:tetratricopeptide repeat protein [Acidobacteriota bacterium]